MAHTVLMKGEVPGTQCVGNSRQAGPIQGEDPRPAPGPGPAAVVCSLALRDLLTYDNMPADVDCVVCQGRGHETSCFFPPRAGRNWK